jgi:hypothetical protein
MSSFCEVHMTVNSWGNRLESIKAFRLTKSPLVVALGLFALGQWTLGRRIGGHTIFTPQSKQIRADFSAFHRALAAQIRDSCASGAIHSIFFEDSDIALPYLVNGAIPQRGCAIVRETLVTPTDPSETLRCSSLFIWELYPSAWSAQPFPPKLGSLKESISPVTHWSSRDGVYSFTSYRKTDCSASHPHPPEA